MSDLQHLIDSLNDTEATLKQLGRDSESRPDDDITLINMASVERRQADLVRRLDHALRTSQNEICRYRVVRETSENYPVSEVGLKLSNG